MRFALILLPALVLPGTMVAQGNPLIGTWRVNAPAGTRITSEGATAIYAEGTLTIVAKEDSLIATLATQPIEGNTPKPPLRLAVRPPASGAVTFTAKTETRTLLNGQELNPTALLVTLVLRVSGDSLGGTMERVPTNDDELPRTGPQPITGQRVKS
ncbi:MAG: hypothetical protein IPP98_05560 [Gemmatimonadetes bacterium]|nr:hypothetical protein [Gemmatimonadota bacterium]